MRPVDVVILVLLSILILGVSYLIVRSLLS